MDPGENFLPYFMSLLFYFLNQTVENNIFHLIFLSLFSILPVFTPTKHTLNLFCWKFEIIFFILLNWEENEERKVMRNSFYINTPTLLHSPTPLTISLLYNKDIIVNLCKLHFSSSHFSLQPNKKVFHFPTFPPL